MRWTGSVGGVVTAAVLSMLGGACGWPKAALDVAVSGNGSGLNLDELVVSVHSVRLNATVDVSFGPPDGRGRSPCPRTPWSV